MKKNILFVINNMWIGGAEKTLISVLHEIDFDKYNVDLFLMKHEGNFLSKIPKKVHLLPAPKNYIYFDSSLKKTILENILKLNFKLIIDRVKFNTLLKGPENWAVKEQKAWKILKNHLPKLEKNYDAAISYLEKTPNYFVIDKVNAKKKLLHMQTDYKILGMDATIDKPYFEKADVILAASEKVKSILHEFFPEYDDKIKVLESIISKKEIDFFSEEKIDDFLENKGVSIVSVGRIVINKIHDLGAEVVKILKERGHKFNWIIVGDGDRRYVLEELIKKYQLQDYITLLGEKNNPYPYIKKAEIFFHLSKFEGSAVTVSEAKCLKKCILLNDFNIAHDIIKNGENGVVVKTDAEDIADELEKLILDKRLRKKYEDATEFEVWRTENAMNLLMNEIES